MNTKQIQKAVLSLWLTDKQNTVNYYRQLHDPEHAQHHGRSVQSKLHDANEELKNAKTDYCDYIHWLNKDIDNDVLKYLPEYKVIQYLKYIINQAMHRAHDFPENWLIVARAYREAITALAMLVERDKKYEVVNARYFY